LRYRHDQRLAILREIRAPVEWLLLFQRSTRTQTPKSSRR
jgi:hypothetical protein